MNSQQARALVAQTFPEAFDQTRFHNFAINLLNQFDASKAQQWNATYIKDAFKGHVQRYERLGTYTSPDNEKLDVLIVRLTNESKLERDCRSTRSRSAGLESLAGQRFASRLSRAREPEGRRPNRACDDEQ